MASPDRVPLRHLIGGRWAVSWQGYVLAWPWAVLFVFSSTPSLWVSTSVGAGIVRGVLVGTLVYLPVGAVLWVADHTLLRHRRDTPVPVTLVALIGGVAWTARSLSMYAVMLAWGVTSEVPVPTRFILGFLQGALAVVLAAWLLATVEQFMTRRRRLLDELVHEELDADRLADGIARLREAMLDDVRRTVDAAVSPLPDWSREGLPSRHDVDAIATASQLVSRSLARTLWADAARSARMSPLVVLRSALTHRPFTFWGLVPGPLIGLFVLHAYWDWSDAVISLAAVTAYAWAISAGANVLVPRLRGSRALLAYAVTIVLLLSSSVVMQAAMGVLNVTPPRGSALLWAVAVNFGVLYPMIGVAGHVGRAQHEVLARLRRSIDEAEVHREALRREDARLRRQLAVFLHGGLQADLTAMVMRAQQAIDRRDAATALRALNEARNLIEHDWDVPRPAPADLLSTVRTVVQSWEGFVVITLDIEVTREPPPRTIAHVKEILLEGIGNAVRHGRAKNIAVTIDDRAGDLRITITDDGTGVTDSRIGLGSVMFHDIAPNAWSLTPGTTGGSMLTVALPTAARP